MDESILKLKASKVSGSDLAEAMKSAGISKPQLAEILEVSLKTVYNLVKSAELRGPYRWAAYTLFPSLRTVETSTNEAA